MSDRESDRLWKTLDKMESELSGINKQLHNISEIKVQVKGHEQTLARFGNRLDIHDSAIHNIEMAQVTYKSDRRQIDRSLQDTSDRVDSLEEMVGGNNNRIYRTEGQKDFGGATLKVIVGIAVTLIVWKITKG